MKNVGMVGFFSSENYGAILQAVALQKKIEEMGCRATYLNYFPPLPVDRLKKWINILYGYLRLLLGYRRRKQRTDAFRERYLKRTARLATYEDARRAAADFDLFIAGSDQIWNPRWLEVSRGYYLLNFIGDRPRFSYASSFGVKSVPEQHHAIYREALKKFFSISVREKSGLRILEIMGMSGARTVLDPTFLLSQEEWCGFFDATPCPGEPYILCHVMPGDHKTAGYIAAFAKKFNEVQGNKYRILVVGDKEYKRFMPGYNLICDAGPAEYLRLMYHASFIITNSFHGTCFALNFNKQFLSVLDRNNPFNARITDLLSTFGIENRLRFTDQAIDLVLPVDIDYETTNNNLDRLRQESLSFLENNLSQGFGEKVWHVGEQ
ncbi:MAG TPA: polysaccharide pyruvyl transferase family protein [bacterium]|nr:polysaccharide pyruvyl transferase family protein [bacterium]